MGYDWYDRALADLPEPGRRPRRPPAALGFGLAAVLVAAALPLSRTDAGAAVPALASVVLGDRIAGTAASRSRAAARPLPTVTATPVAPPVAPPAAKPVAAPPAQRPVPVDWDALAACESSGRWALDIGLFDGGLQFLPSTWDMFGGREHATYAWQATRQQQIAVAERVLAGQGWEAWPTCSRRLGWR